MPDIENSRKTAEKGAGKQPENSRNTRKKQLFCSFGRFPAVFRLFCCDPLGTFVGCFPDVFNVGHLAPL